MQTLGRITAYMGARTRLATTKGILLAVSYKTASTGVHKGEFHGGAEPPRWTRRKGCPLSTGSFFFPVTISRSRTFTRIGLGGIGIGSRMRLALRRRIGGSGGEVQAGRPEEPLEDSLLVSPARPPLTALFLRQPTRRGWV